MNSPPHRDRSSKNERGRDRPNQEEGSIGNGTIPVKQLLPEHRRQILGRSVAQRRQVRPVLLVHDDEADHDTFEDSLENNFISSLRPQNVSIQPEVVAANSEC